MVREREPLSVVVTTFNSAATLERCLASVAWADDIVVLDSGSTDVTVEIAAKFRARVFSEPFRDYAMQKQSAIDKAAHAWVLLLDSDEVVTAAARPVIEAALEPLEARGIIVAERGRVRVRDRNVLRYYARTLDHLLASPSRRTH